MMLWVCMALLAAGCASVARSRDPRPNGDLLELVDIQNATQPNAYELIRNLRPHWLEVRGGGSVGATMVKRVYLDDLDLGGIEHLRQITTPTIESIRYYDGPAATQRWGSGHAAGVIQIRTRS